MGALSRITNVKFQKAEVTITMLKVYSVSIKNYRAIENLEFSPNSINVFVGPNNCGKSSVLEAIAVTAPPIEIGGIQGISAQRLQPQSHNIDRRVLVAVHHQPTMGTDMDSIREGLFDDHTTSGTSL